MEKIKIVVPFRSHPTRNRKFQKNSKKIQKIKKYHYGVISSQNWLEKAKGEKIKILVLFRPFPARNRKFLKNRKKFKKLKNTIVASFQPKKSCKRQRNRENKNCRSISFPPNV